MHPYTKHTLADALKDMLGTKTLDKITVKDLVEACKLNRSSLRPRVHYGHSGRKHILLRNSFLHGQC